VRPLALALNLGPAERLPARRDVSLTSALADMRVGAEEVAFTGPAHLQATVRRRSGGADVDGRVSAPARLRCGRCLDPYDILLEGEVEVRYRLDAAGDEDAMPYGPVVDLAGPVEEALVLAMPVVPLCRSDCPGLCPACGRRRGDGGCRCLPADTAADGPFAALRAHLGPERKK
jgi:uncharacterized protein